jgi:hypothetical protein
VYKHYVKCTDKHPTHTDVHGRIRYVGTNRSESKTNASKKWTVGAVISAIRDGDKFYCDDQYGDAALVVVASRNGVPYIKTESDDVETDNLLAQRECSWKKR